MIIERRECIRAGSSLELCVVKKLKIREQESCQLRAIVSAIKRINEAGRGEVLIKLLFTGPFFG